MAEGRDVRLRAGEGKESREMRMNDHSMADYEEKEMREREGGCESEGRRERKQGERKSGFQWRRGGGVGTVAASRGRA